ncbi:MAG: saccharopine dehydrogenase NADP-binding domain-containing protein [Terricaulis sp.]|nr:saccharopine dehydrogenase NADP-binding domain-containing protein [Terricaulis sp.]
MKKVLIIGAGGVGTVVAHKCAQNPAVFGDILLATRTESRAKAIAQAVKEKNSAATSPPHAWTPTTWPKPWPCCAITSPIC